MDHRHNAFKFNVTKFLLLFRNAIMLGYMNKTNFVADLWQQPETWKWVEGKRDLRVRENFVTGTCLQIYFISDTTIRILDPGGRVSTSFLILVVNTSRDKLLCLRWWSSRKDPRRNLKTGPRRENQDESQRRSTWRRLTGLTKPSIRYEIVTSWQHNFGMVHPIISYDNCWQQWFRQDSSKLTQNQSSHLKLFL